MRKSLIALLHRHRSFVIPYLLFIIIGLVIQSFVSKTELFLWVNRHHDPFFDQFFKLNTLIGSEFTMALVGLGMLFVKYRYSVVTVLAYAYTAAITQIIKRIFNSPRPSTFFEGLNPIRTIDGYPLYEWNSFPSGHSVSAFTLAVLLAYLLPYKKKEWIILPVALLTAFSRVYLSQHFFQDVLAGAILGCMLTFQLIWWLENTTWYHSPKLEGRLLGKRI